MIKLEDLKVGDKVFRHRKWGNPSLILTITGTTKQHLIVNDTKYRKSDGSAVGEADSRRICAIQEGQLEIHEKLIAKNKRIQEIRNAIAEKKFVFNGYPEWFPIEKWEKIYKTICE